MNEDKRQKNETDFDSWIEIEDGRIYSFEIAGKLSWKAEYLKEVNRSNHKILAGSV